MIPLKQLPLRYVLCCLLLVVLIWKNCLWRPQRSVTCRTWRLWTCPWTSWCLSPTGCTAASLCRIWQRTTTRWATFPGSSAGSTALTSSPWPLTGWPFCRSVSNAPLSVCCHSDADIVCVGKTMLIIPVCVFQIWGDHESCSLCSWTTTWTWKAFPLTCITRSSAAAGNTAYQGPCSLFSFDASWNKCDGHAAAHCYIWDLQNML